MGAPVRRVATMVAAACLAACARRDGVPGAAGRAAGDDTLRIGVLTNTARSRATLPAVAIALEAHNATRPAGTPPLALLRPREREARLDALARWQDDPRVVAVIGADGAEPTLAAASLLRAEVVHGRLPTPMVTVSASAQHVTGLTPWLFRLAPRVDAIVHGALAIARDTLGARTVAIAHSADVVGREAMARVLALQARIGVRVVATAAYDEAMHDLPLAARHLRDARPDLLVVLSGDVALTAQLLRELRATGARIPVLGGPASGGLAEWGDEFAGTSWVGDGAAATIPEAFHAQLAARLPDSAQAAPIVGAFAARAHDAARLVAAAVARAGADRARIRDLVAQGLPAGTPGLVSTGALRFDAGNDADMPLRHFRLAAREALP